MSSAYLTDLFSGLIACFYLCCTVHARVVSSYETSLEDEVQLKVGDVVKDIHMTDARYWTGNLKGRRGHFPKDCVELLSEGKCCSYQVRI